MRLVRDPTIRIFKLKIYGCCNHHGCPARYGFRKRSWKPGEKSLIGKNCTFRAKCRWTQKLIKRDIRPCPFLLCYHSINMTEGYPPTLKFLTWCMSKSPRSDCFWVRPPVAHIEVICDWAPPPDGSKLPIPVEELLFTAKGFRSNISEKLRSFEV